MTEKTRRRDLFRPVQLIGLSLLCAVFAGAVTLFSTGAFTEDVIRMVRQGTYAGLPPWNLAFIVTVGIFIVTLLILSILLLAVNPADFAHPHDRPVLYEDDDAQAGSEDGSGSGTAHGSESGTAEGPGSASEKGDAPKG